MANKGTAFSDEQILELAEIVCNQISAINNELEEIGVALKKIADNEEAQVEVFQGIVDLANSEASKFRETGVDSIPANLKALQDKLVKVVQAINTTFSIDTTRKVRELTDEVSAATKKALEDSKRKNA